MQNSTLRSATRSRWSKQSANKADLDVDGEDNCGHFEDKTIETYKMDEEKSSDGNG